MCTMNRDWARLGEAIVRAYESLGLRQKEFADLAGVSPSTLYRLEKGSGPAPSDSTLAKIERALSWHSGSAVEVAEGGRIPAAALPTTARVRKPGVLSDPSILDQLPTQISEELQQPGEVLGVDVIDLGPDDSGARMIVVVKRDASVAEPSPETVRATLQEWQRKRSELWRRRDESGT